MCFSKKKKNSKYVVVILILARVKTNGYNQVCSQLAHRGIGSNTIPMDEDSFSHILSLDEQNLATNLVVT